MVPSAAPPDAPAVFLRDGEQFVPTELARGPWDPDAQHGGAPAGLVARAVEAVPSAAPMQVARITMELLRPVPLTPLRLATEVVRPGKRVDLLETYVFSGATPVVRAMSLRIRTADVQVPEGVDEAPPVPGPEEAETAVRPAGAYQGVSFSSTALDIRTAAGAFDRPGPTTAWFRLRQPLVDDEPPSPLVRVAAAADFGNGISWVLPFDRYVFINPDLTIHLHRLPRGEWICLDARTFLGGQGMATAESALYDTLGRVGRGVQSLILDRRG